MPQFPPTGVGVVTGPGVDGADANAEQLAVVPPLEEPPQLHVHGPEPATDDDVPVEQRLAEGADDAVVPFADPHAPLTAAAAAVTTTVVLATADVPLAPVQVSV
jgi:hypothetical protein